MQVDHHFHEWLTPERVDSVLAGVRGTPPPHGPHNGHRPGEEPHPLVSAEGAPAAVPGLGRRRVRPADAAQVPIDEPLLRRPLGRVEEPVPPPARPRPGPGVRAVVRALGMADRPAEDPRRRPVRITGR